MIKSKTLGFDKTDMWNKGEGFFYNYELFVFCSLKTDA